MSIHPTAVISPDARIDRDVVIGALCVVESDVAIGEGCRIESHVSIKHGTSLGPDNHVCEGTVLGGLPQHAKMPEVLGRLVIGAENSIREYVTIHRALEFGHTTTIGDQNLIMVHAHVGHDCHVGNSVVLINNVMLAGHVCIEDRAYVAAASGVQQFRRVGRLATVGAQGRVNRDLPPFVTMDGLTHRIVGLNLVGLRRAGFSREDIRQLKDAYRLIYRSGLKWEEVMRRLPEEFTEGPAADFHRFFATGEHGFIPERRTPAAAVVPFEPGSRERVHSLRLKTG